MKTKLITITLVSLVGVLMAVFLTIPNQLEAQVPPGEGGGGLPTPSFAVDFDTVDYGSVLLSTLKKVSGDLIFSYGDGRPTIRNTGDTPIEVTITQDDMGFGKTGDQWNIEFGARIGSNEVDWKFYNPNTSISLGVLQPGEVKDIDFAVHVKKWLYSDIYVGTMTLNDSVKISTKLTRATGGGSLPIIKAKWEMNGPYSSLRGTDDDHATGAQFTAPQEQDGTMSYSVCAIVEDPDGTADISGVYADIFYPSGVLREQNALIKLSKIDGYRLFCEVIKENNENLPIFNNNHFTDMTRTEIYDEICGISGELIKEAAEVFCDDKILRWEDPVGPYKVVTYAQDKAGNLSNLLENYFETSRLVKVSNTPDGIWSLRQTYGKENKPADDVLMIVPNDWVFKLISKIDENGQIVKKDGYIWWKVENPGNGISGWMAAQKSDGSEKYLLPGDPEKAKKLTTKDARVNAILETVDHYYNDPSLIKSLYSSNDNKNNFQLFKNISFPVELILAIIAQESRETCGRKGGEGGEVICTAFNNALKTWDGGYGIIQITTPIYKGMGSRVQTYQEICEEFRQVWVYDKWLPEYLCNWYTNINQGIYANIKDGLRVLQEKYREKCPKESIWIEGYEFTCRDIEKILMTWGYNGISYDTFYLTLVADKLQNLNTYFPGYYNIEDLRKKLIIADQNKQEVVIYSPANFYIIDSQGRITGVINGEIKEEILNSMYDSDTKSAVILFPEENYHYNIEGTEEGTYGFAIDSTDNGIFTIFNATDIPILPQVVHQYTIDWQKLSQGEKSVTLQIDTNSDGVFEKTVIADNDLTYDEFILQTETIIDFDPNTLNLKEKGKFVTFYIGLPGGYEVGQIDIFSIVVNDSVPVLPKPTEIGDYDGDGIPDLMVKFERSKVQAILSPGEEIIITLTGKVFYNGNYIDFKGSDVIRVIEKENSK